MAVNLLLEHLASTDTEDAHTHANMLKQEGNKGMEMLYFSYQDQRGNVYFSLSNDSGYLSKSLRSLN